MDDRKIVGWDEVAWISLSPGVVHLRGFFEVAGCVVVIVRLDIEALYIADAVAEIEGLASLFGGGDNFSQVVVASAERSMSHSEIGIEFDGPFQRRDGSGVISAATHDLSSGAERLESFERRGCRLRDGCVEFLDGAEGFAEFLAQVGGGAVERFEDLGFSFGADLLLRDDVAGGAIHGFDADDVFVVEAGDGAFDNGGALGALADFAGDFGSEMSVSRLAHQAERLLDALFGDDAQEGRLFELDGESLFESVVEDGVTGGVGE